MRRRKISAARVKKHRAYTVEELAETTGAVEATVRTWVKRGLPALTAQRPMLILGRDVLAFMNAETNRRRRPIQLGEFFCFRCKESRKPALGIADYVPLSRSHGRLVALCDTCERECSRMVSIRNLPNWHAFCEIGGSYEGND
ncbi:helix-turn-helix domain-containing protein [Defluviimonas aestuarii]|uniref:helix-turn-helix domain-containing protein n=1 Tax=Albidovulum aestuarii TaxID=1130726 RepID=UPI00249B506F|nr:helix-turn-helix domain-containing protein [Defluviimonas aestuarii]MDI3337926.1 helix-turn-helix domain-containing protein [Defluviimonas aestuarii]